MEESRVFVRRPDDGYPTAVALLSSKGLGSAERSRYLDQIRSAGPTELSNYAHQAIARNDPILGAAVLSVLTWS